MHVLPMLPRPSVYSRFSAVHKLRLGSVYELLCANLWINFSCLPVSFYCDSQFIFYVILPLIPASTTLHFVRHKLTNKEVGTHSEYALRRKRACVLCACGQLYV